MIELSLSDLPEVIRATQAAYYKLTVIVGPSGCGKTQVLRQVATELQLPVVNLSLLLSQRLLSQTRRQRALKAEEIAIEVIDEHLQSGLCLDNTELLFDSSLRLNALVFLQEASRNRLIVASWNGALVDATLRFAYADHPDFFSQPFSGYPAVAIAGANLRVHLTS